MVSNMARDMTVNVFVNLNNRIRSKNEPLIVVWKDIETLTFGIESFRCSFVIGRKFF